MKVLVKCFTVLFLVSGLILISCGKKGEEPETGEISLVEEEAPEAEIELPWIFGGYTKLDQFHLRYYYVSGKAVMRVLRGEMSWEESIKENTRIDDVWFKSDGSLFRLDRYVEKIEAKCESYEGAPPDTISYNGKTYSLYERLIQKGLQETNYTFAYRTKTGYDEQSKQAIAQDCYYERITSEASKEQNHSSAISEAVLGLVIYHSSGSDDKESLISDLELDKLMNPSRYKRIMEGWKLKQKIAGRTAVKHYYAIPVVAVGVEGFQFLDTKLGIGLVSYIEECRAFKEIKFEEPKLRYKALLVETTVSLDVFEIF